MFEEQLLHFNIKMLVMEVRKYLARVGSKKLYHILKLDLKIMDIEIGRDKFHEILKDLRLLVPKRKRFTRTTMSNHLFNKHKNLVKAMKLNKPEQLWVTDITYVKTATK